MHRIRVSLILTALCLAAVALAACGGGSKDPQQVLESATFEGIESAAFDGTLEIESKGSQGGHLDVRLSGRAQAEEGVEVTAKVDGSARGKPVDLEGGLTLFANRGFVNYRGTEYEVDPNNYGIAKPLFFPALAEKGGAEIRECRRAAAGIEVGDLLDNLSDEGSVEVADTETTGISGELDVAAAVEAFIGFVEDPACSTQFEALSPFALYQVRLLGEELTASAEKSTVHVYVGDDGIVRKFSAEFRGVPGAGRAPVTVDIELTLSEINEEQKIAVPAHAKPIFTLLGKLGVSPFEFLSWVDGGEGVRKLGESVAADAFP
ncbi:MAG TPA: hypothetical protein VGO13_09295 [Solirubrobacterales bacterium]|jgi:hypothetical protein|nr:hypothetical protein [Solirubrobacterales bacterium]